MSLSRTLKVIVMVFVLLAIAVPAAQAGALERSQGGLSLANGSWLTASMSWLAQLFGFDRQAPPVIQKVVVTIPLPPVRPMTGACIDPLGGTGNNGGGPGGTGSGGGGGRPCNM